MAWKESCAMDERLGFIVDCIRGETSMSELCERYGVSRKTGYKWLSRYHVQGAAGLAERSHAPLHHGRATAEAEVAAIEGLRREHPSWGPRKIIGKLVMLRPEVAWPSASTAGEILKRAGLVSGRRLHRRAPPRQCASPAGEGGRAADPATAGWIVRPANASWLARLAAADPPLGAATAPVAAD